MPDPNPRSPSRRRLLLGGLAAVGAGTAAALHYKPWYRPLGSNSDIRLGIAGLGGKGLDHVLHFDEIPGARITAICDPDPNQIDKIFAETNLQRGAVRAHADFRHLVDDPDTDAIVIASPNHWHALMGVWAMQAGKHVYVEKPVSHSIWEGQMLVEAAQKYGRISQAGTQRRSDEAYREAASWLAEGHIGQVTSAHAVVYLNRKPVTLRKSPTPMPEGIDFDHWSGPAPVENLYRSRLHYSWHWHWATGNGELGNNGIHFLDVARIILGESDLPSTATSIGGRLGWTNDAGQTPNSQIVVFDYETPMIAEIRNLPMSSGAKAMDHHDGVREGLVVHCEGGTLAWPVARDSAGKKLKKFNSHDGYGHRVNWLRAIADGRPGDLNAPLREGHISSALCHLGNASHLAGATRTPEEIAETIAATPSALAAYEKLTDHLAKNGIDLAETPLTFGAPTRVGEASAPPEMRPPYNLL